MTIRHLKVFITVCKYNNFTRAAEELHIAQPAVSTTIAEIEKYYSVLLFERINKKIILTEAGKKLLVKAREVVTSFDDFESLANQTETTTMLKIGASLTIGRTIIPKLLSIFKQDYPETAVSVSIGQALDIERKVADGILDFALVEGRVSFPNIKVKPFAEDKLIPVGGKDFIVPPKLTVQELSKLPLLLREKGSSSRDFVDSLFSIQALTAHPIVESASNEAIISIAAQNHGIAILPQSIVKEHIGQSLKEINVLDVSFNRKFYLIHHKDKKINIISQTMDILKTIVD
ncbi:MAG: LysR family transcriptional regulator [Eubacteriales bacterium]|nr:LysR family transcriptional regulator [Eubacteriales bacterium]